MAKLQYLTVIITILHLTMEEEVAEGGCSCAVLPVQPSELLIIEHALEVNVTCDQEGAFKCQHLCVLLAESVKDRAPTIICEKFMRDIDNLLVAVYSKSCGNDAWHFTGIKTTEPICCHDRNPVICNTILSTLHYYSRV